MVDQPRTEPPKGVVWLSPNCCDLTPAAQRPEPQAPVLDNPTRVPPPPRPRLLGLLRGKPRT